MEPDRPELVRVDTLTPAVLRDAFRRALMESGAVAQLSTVTGDDLLLEAQTRRANRFTIDLHSLFLEAQSVAPELRVELIAQRVRGSVETARHVDGEAPSPSCDQVVPTIRSQRWLAGLPTSDLATEPLVADLVIVYAFDRDHTMAYASRSDLQSIGLTPENARDVALANLRARIPPQLETHGDDLCFLFGAGGDYESSLILLDEVWDQLGATMPGDIVACVVARDICLVTGAAIDGGIESLIAARDRIADGDDPPTLISTTLLRREQGRWTVLGS